MKDIDLCDLPIDILNILRNEVIKKGRCHVSESDEKIYIVRPEFSTEKYLFRRDSEGKIQIFQLIG